LIRAAFCSSVAPSRVILMFTWGIRSLLLAVLLCSEGKDYHRVSCKTTGKAITNSPLTLEDGFHNMPDFIGELYGFTRVNTVFGTNILTG